MKALVTGATGFVGAAVARALLNDGWQVRALARVGSDRRNLQTLDLTIVDGDLTQPHTLQAAAEGCEALFHVAADYRLGARDPSPLYQTNVEGTLNMLRAAKSVGVKRMVYTSSVAAVGIPKDGTPGDEDTPVALADMIGHYKRSKFLAEQAVRQAAQEGMPVVMVSPSTPVGGGDIKPTPTGQLILDAASGRMPAYVDTGLNIVHVDDVAQGHLLAYHHGRIGERYILGGENLPLQQMLADIAGMVGRKAPTIALPRWPLYPLAMGAETVAKFTKREPFVTVDALKMSKNKMYFTSAKAERELGYRARPYREGLRDALDWFREAGYLSPKVKT